MAKKASRYCCLFFRSCNVWGNQWPAIRHFGRVRCGSSYGKTAGSGLFFVVVIVDDKRWSWTFILQLFHIRPKLPVRPRVLGVRAHAHHGLFGLRGCRLLVAASGLAVAAKRSKKVTRHKVLRDSRGINSLLYEQHENIYIHIWFICVRGGTADRYKGSSTGLSHFTIVWLTDFLKWARSIVCMGGSSDLVGSIQFEFERRNGSTNGWHRRLD